MFMLKFILYSTQRWIQRVLWTRGNFACKLSTTEYLLISHRNKIWCVEERETLIEARHMFGDMYNPIKCFFDLYLDVPMPSTYIDCKFTMKYREYMRWELVYFTSDLEVACRHLKKFVKDCISYKQLDLLAKIVSKIKQPLEKYYVCNRFWENKIKK